MIDITKHSRPFLMAALTTGLLACGPILGDGGGFGETGDESETGETGEGPEVEPPYGPEPGDGDSGDGDPGVGVAPVPGDGDGDPVEECDYLGCPCVADGCVENLVCDLSEHCSPCPPGSPGCVCGVGQFCEVGQCSTGTDADGTNWSICYPADLLGCVVSECPGDAHCTDNFECAWQL